MLLDIVSEPNKLHALVGIRNGNQNGLIETAAHHFYLSGFHQGFQALKIFRAILFNPGEQRTRVMEANVDARMLLQGFDEGQVAAIVGLLKNMAKIAARLMGVNEQD
jgi:hypothetical protein